MDKKEIKFTPITIIGVGGVGSIIADLLYSLGARKVMLIDDDVVEKRNLQRQNFKTEDIGKSKAKVLAERYGFTGIQQRFNGDEVIDGIIFCCVDNNESRAIIAKEKNIKIFCANETLDAEAYLGIDEIITHNSSAFNEEEQVISEEHCDQEFIDTQTKIANMTAAIMGVQLLMSLNLKLFKQRNGIIPAMIRNAGGNFETLRLKDFQNG